MFINYLVFFQMDKTRAHKFELYPSKLLNKMASNEIEKTADGVCWLIFGFEERGLKFK